MSFQQDAFQQDAFQAAVDAFAAAAVFQPFQTDGFQFYYLGDTPVPAVDASGRFYLTPMNPYVLEWLQWWGVATVDLAETGYNLTGSVEESVWQTWATELLQSNDLVELGIPSPLPFGDDWRAWAAILHSLTA